MDSLTLKATARIQQTRTVIAAKDGSTTLQDKHALRCHSLVMLDTLGILPQANVSSHQMFARIFTTGTDLSANAFQRSAPIAAFGTLHIATAWLHLWNAAKATVGTTIRADALRSVIARMLSQASGDSESPRLTIASAATWDHVLVLGDTGTMTLAVALMLGQNARWESTVTPVMVNANSTTHASVQSAISTTRQPANANVSLNNALKASISTQNIVIANACRRIAKMITTGTKQLAHVAATTTTFVLASSTLSTAPAFLTAARDTTMTEKPSNALAFHRELPTTNSCSTQTPVRSNVNPNSASTHSSTGTSQHVGASASNRLAQKTPLGTMRLAFVNAHLMTAAKATFLTLRDAPALSAKMSLTSKTALKESSGIRPAARACACLCTAQASNSGQVMTASVCAMQIQDIGAEQITWELTRTAIATLMLSLTSS